MTAADDAADDVHAGFCARLCRGKTPCYVNTLCYCCVMWYQACVIYGVGCCFEYFRRALDGAVCCICKALCWGCCLHKDSKFPADASSIGAWNGKTPAEIDAEVEWKRAQDCMPAAKAADGKPEQRLKLFEDGIEVKDVAQGGVGDCWLISAMCCLAERPGQVYKCFTTASHNDRGKYTVRLYDGRAKKWLAVTVDDLLPVERKSGRLLFAQPQGRELWVLILEKAFAKFCGSYEALNGGHEIWAFEALTGDPVLTMIKKGESWVRHDLAHMKDSKKIRAIGLRVRDEKHSDSDMFYLVRTYVKAEAFMSASISNDGESKDKNTGLVAGHAYSLLDARAFSVDAGLLFLVRLRNPWGKFEWSGAWSDGSAEWAANPKIKKLIKPRDEDDGSFWMSWDDFISHFNSIDICNRSRGVRDLYLDLKEDDGCKDCLGPLKGCASGCVSFWLGCRGVKALYCGKTATENTLEMSTGRDDDLLSTIQVAIQS